MKLNSMKKYVTLILAMFVLTGYVQAQTTLKGKVSDEKGEALIGVSVYLKGTSVGGSTDIDGNYILNVPAGVETTAIIFSFIGYITQEVAVEGRSEINVILQEDTKVLSEVVITGYSTEQRAKVTGAVTTVKTDALLRVPVPTLDQALQGRAAGVVVTQNTGAPGEGVSIRIRGVGSINSGNYPLYVIDGIPALNVDGISLNDMAGINILKDASAAAIYGARAANGVVVLTTKSGKGKAPQIEINSQFGVQTPSRLIDMANTREYVKIYNEAAANDNVGKSGIFLRPLITETMAEDFDDVDYIKEIMQDAIIQSHSITASGSSGKTNYLLSVSYFNQEGIIKSSAYNRLTGRANIETEVKSWLTTGMNLNMSRANRDFIPSSGDGAGGNGGSVIRYAFFRTPAIPIYDANGEFTDRPDLYRYLGDGYSPVGMLAYNQNHRVSDQLFGKFYVKISPLPGLTLLTNFGFDVNHQNQRRFDRNWGSANRINNPNRLTVAEANGRAFTINNVLTYNKSFDKNNFVFIAGTESIKNNLYGFAATDNDFPDQKKSLVYMGNGQGIKTTTESETSNSLLSVFGKVGYDFDSRYIASVTFRRDGSSRFGPDNRWGNFYAGSLGWQMKSESFLQNVDWIEGLLVRAGYGSIGNQEISDFPYVEGVGNNYNYPFGNVQSNGFAINQLGNTKVKWESSNQFNAGIDFEILRGELYIMVDYFNKVTTDLLVNQPIPPSAGQAGAPIVNNGKMVNRGIEVAINHVKTINSFRYEVNANFSTVQNEMLSVNPVIQGGAIGSDRITLVEEGYPVSSFYLYEMEGIFQDAADIFTHANQGAGIKPGDVKYKDQNRDGFITAADRKHIGSPIPDVTAALNINLRYKNWDMSIFFQGAYGHEIFSVLNRDIEGFYRPFNVTQRYYDEHWTGPGTSNSQPRASWDASGNNTKYSTRFLEDGSYTRLKNLQVGYSLPTTMLDRIGFASCRVYISGTNLLTFTKYEGGMDPEMTVSDNALNEGERSAGMDWGTYPSAKSYNVGITLTF
jgi:TonB-linked SusC/RagA family outer membrane protein